MTNEKWWDNSEWAPFQEDFKQAYIEPLVAEAERRGEMKAWEEIHALHPVLINVWVTGWLRDKYGLEDHDTLNAEEVEEIAQDLAFDLAQSFKELKTT